MSSAINFAVRDAAGGLQNGAVAGDGFAGTINVAAGDSISLNISQASVVAFRHVGGDLVIELVDGRQIVLTGWYDQPMGAQKLYFSTDGELQQVYLMDSGDGTLFATYAGVEVALNEKWSPLDGLRHDEPDLLAGYVSNEDEPAGMGMFVPGLVAGGGGLGAAAAGAALLGGAALSGGGGGSGGGDTGGGGTGGGGTGGGGTGGGGTGGGGTGGGGTGGGGTGGGGTGGGGTGGGGTGGGGTGGGGTDGGGTGGGDTGGGGTGGGGTGGGGTGGGGTGGGTGGGGTGGGGTGGGGTGGGGTGGGTGGGGTGGGGTGGGDTGGGGTGGGGTGGGTGGGGTGGGGTGGGGTGGGGTGGGGTGGGTGGGGTGGGGTGGGGTGGGDTGGGGTGGGGTGGGGTGGGGSGGGGGGGVPPHTPPTVNGTGTTSTVTTKTADPSLVVSGGGHPGDSVTVTIGGGSQTTTIGQNGTWTVTFPPAQLPADGNYTAGVVVNQTNGTTTTLVGPGYIIDMTPPPVLTTDGTQSSGDVENLAEYADGVTISGTGEAGASVSVTVAGSTRTTTIDSSGNWAVTFTQSQVPGGETSHPVTVTATDIHGNTTTITDTLVMDTVPNPLTIGTVAGDDFVNRTEVGASVAIGGTTAPGATVTVSVQGVPGSFTATANVSGGWSLSLPANTFPAGTYDRTITASTVDAAGNPTQVTKTITIDTETFVNFNPVTGHAVLGDGFVNYTESQGTITLTGRTEPGATAVTVGWTGAAQIATVAADGTWSATFPAGSAGVINRDSTFTVTSWDRAGNSASATLPVRIDLDTAVTLMPQPAGADNTLNAAERAAGLTLTGTAEPGAQVYVSYNNVTKTPVRADAAGNWSVNFAPSDLPQGEITSGSAGRTISVYSVDAAGNVSQTVTHTLDVDTLVRNFGFPAPDLVGSVNTGGNDASTLNAAERAAGLTVQGSVEPGSTVTLQVGAWSQTIPASQTASGTWSYTIPASALPDGSNTTATILATARDAFGNVSQTLSQTVAIDTFVTNFAASTISLGPAADGWLNAKEAVAGMPVSGRAEAGSTVSVQIGNVTHSAVADANGNWTVHFARTDLPSGEVMGVTASVIATDLAGNTSGPHVLTFNVDTIAPESPWVTQDFGTSNLISGLATETAIGSYTYHTIPTVGAATQLNTTPEMVVNSLVGGRPVESDFVVFSPSVPDGSYLVVRGTDIAGNESSTLYIRNTSSEVTVDLNRPGLHGFALSTLDLSASDANLTITEAQINAVTGPDKMLVIRGGADDVVTMVGAADTHMTQTIDGHTYSLYTLGNARVLVDDDIQRNMVV